MNLRHVGLLVVKELTQLRRDPMLARIIVIMPLSYLLIFGYVVAAEIRDLQAAFVDLDRSVASRTLAGAFQASGYFDLVAHPASELDVRGLLDSGTVRVVIVVPAGTQAALDAGRPAPVSIVVDGSNSATAGVATGYALATVNRFNADLMAATGLTVAGPNAEARVTLMYDPSLLAVHTLLPGLMMMIMILSLMVVMSQAVVRERESGTLEQLFVTPVGRTEYLTGKLLPYVGIAIVQSLLIAAMSVWWFGMPFRGSFAVVSAGMGLFLLIATGLGLLVSLLSRTRAQAQQTVILMMIPTMLLSGFIFPIESMPAAIQPVAYAIPVTYALQIMRAALVKGSDFTDLAFQFWMLVGFVVLIFGAAILLTRRRLSE